MGRDVWSQFVHGARVSLAVGFGAGITVCFLATVIGMYPQVTSVVVSMTFLTAAMNIMLVIPQYPLLFVLAAFIGEAGPINHRVRSLALTVMGLGRSGNSFTNSSST